MSLPFTDLHSLDVVSILLQSHCLFPQFLYLVFGFESLKQNLCMKTTGLKAVV